MRHYPRYQYARGKLIADPCAQGTQHLPASNGNYVSADRTPLIEILTGKKSPRPGPKDRKLGAGGGKKALTLTLQTQFFQVQLRYQPGTGDKASIYFKCSRGLPDTY